ncbi:MAG: YegS/Rv2252/BmrU family lipid kinase [Rikenellaceae bacterium]|nr:YegS/Rv2252/BmrU family lipid kinase [Rikenellaceae bacterium]
MKKVKLLYNPSSGDNRIVNSLNDIITTYQKHGLHVTPHILEFGSSDIEFLTDIDENDDHIIAAGGDGTINHIVNILMDNNIDIPLALLRTGTANDFANLIGVPSDIIEACEKNIKGTVRKLDLGKVNDKYFMNVFSCGLFTDVSQKTPTIMKNTFGKLAYYFSSIGELPSFKKMHLNITANGEEVYSDSALIFFVFNGKTAGNLKIAYLSDIQDGFLDILLVKGDNIGEIIRTVFHYMTHNRHKSYPKDIIHVKSNDIVITSASDETTDIDGQPGPSFPLKITCEPGAVKVICPRAKMKLKD